MPEIRLYWACSIRFLLCPGPPIQTQAVRWLCRLPKLEHRRCRTGFSLAELLVSLLIIAQIATFTIPKVLNAQQNTAWNSSAKEVAGMISAAYQKMQLAGTTSLNTQPSDLTPYMNYVATDTATPIDDWQTGGTWGCDATVPCLVLHNGGRLAYYAAGHSFSVYGGANKDKILLFQYDPDGKYSGSTSGPGKAIAFTLYYNGGISTEGTPRPGSNYDGSGNFDPPWFSWN
jgi:prepilin-type N-terminal cleavage/methylation domain-containing protein